MSLHHYTTDVYITQKRRRCRIVDFNPWGGATLPLLFDWSELEHACVHHTSTCAHHTEEADKGEEGEGGFTDEVDFRVVESQGHIRPSLQLGVPFDMYDTGPDGAIAAMMERRRKEQESEAATGA